MRIVMKFGGTSVGDGQRIKEAAGLVSAKATQGHAIVVVVSAMSGVTDALIRSARGAAEGDEQTYRAAQRTLAGQYRVALEYAVGDSAVRTGLRNQITLLLDGFADFCRSIHILGELTPRALDAVASLGERMTAPIFAEALGECGAEAEAIEGTEVIVTDDRFTQASPLMEATRDKTGVRLQPLLDAGTIPVVTGFIGTTRGMLNAQTIFW